VDLLHPQPSTRKGTLRKGGTALCPLPSLLAGYMAMLTATNSASDQIHHPRGKEGGGHTPNKCNVSQSTVPAFTSEAQAARASCPKKQAGQRPPKRRRRIQPKGLSGTHVRHSELVFWGALLPNTCLESIAPTPCLVPRIFAKFFRFPVTSNLWTHAWSIKCR
jgi:hypothetical protein